MVSATLDRTWPIYGDLARLLVSLDDHCAVSVYLTRDLVVTIVAVFWSRVELQALRYMPWMVLHRGQHVETNEYSLDYTAMLPPTVLIQSFKRKHFLVFFTSIITILLKIQVILSPSIFQLVSVQVSKPVEVSLLDSFAVPDDIGDGAYASSYANVLALRQFDMNLPFGVSDDFAYQTFGSSNRTDQRSRPVVDAPLEVVVDGLFMDTECLLLENYTISLGQAQTQVEGYFEANFTLQFQSCDKEIKVRTDGITGGSYDPGQAYWSTHPYAEDEHPCASLPQQNPQFLYIAAYFTSPSQEGEAPDIQSCAAVVCSSHAWTSKVEVVDDGINPKTARVADQDANATLDIDPWQLLGRSVDAMYYPYSSTGSISGPIELFYELAGTSLEPDDMSLYQSHILREAMESMTDYFGPMVAHYQLRQESSNQIEGSITQQVDKLQVNLGICISVAILFALCACLALSAIQQSRNMSKLWQRDPATLLGLMAMMPSDKEPPPPVGSSRSSTKMDNKRQWSNCTYGPLVLRTWLRVIFSILVLGLISGLLFTLDTSQRNDGLANVSKEGYSSLLWQSLPALAMLSVSLYTSSSDTALRGLGVLSNLSHRSCQSPELDMSFLDMLGFRAFYHSIQYKTPAITLSQALATICGFLPIISSVLFSPEPVPDLTHITTEQQSWFGYRVTTINDTSRYGSNRDSLSSLTLMHNMANFTFPRNTYNDMVFPTFDIEDSNWGPGRTAQVTIPGAKLVPQCAKVSEQDFDIKGRNWTEEQVFYEAQITQNYTCPDGSRLNSTASLTLSAATEKYGMAYFGDVVDSPDNVRSMYFRCSKEPDSVDEAVLNPPWRTQTYVWGNFSAATMDFDHLAVWKCNYSWAEVMTEMNLLWSEGDIVIGHNNPPVTMNSSTLQPWTPPFSIPVFESSMVDWGIPDVFPSVDLQNPTAGGVTNRFGAIMQPFGPLRLEDFGEPDKDDAVLEALHSSLGFAVAQLANLEHRLNLTETSDTSPESPGTLQPITGTITDHGRHRLLQDPKITYVIIAILALTVAANIWALLSALLRRLLSQDGKRRSWLLDMGLKGLAPDGFGSAAMMESLLQDSNSLRAMPHDAERMPPGELYQSLAGRRFRLGWFSHGETGEDEFTIGVLDDHEFQFKGGRRRFGKSY